MIDINDDVCKKNMQRLTNQMWKLIPMRENGEDWKRQLNTVIVEVAGLHEIFKSPSFLQLLSKLEGLRTVDIDFMTYRRIVFESINLLQGLIKNG